MLPSKLIVATLMNCSILTEPCCPTGACPAKPSSTSCTTRGSWGRTLTPTGPRYSQHSPGHRGTAQPGTGSSSSSLSPQNGTCKFQPEKAIAFVKDVINITQVSSEGSFPNLQRARRRCWDAQGVLGSAAGAAACVLLETASCWHCPEHLEGGTKELLEPKSRPWVHLQAGTESWFSSHRSAPDPCLCAGRQGYPLPWLLVLHCSQHSRERWLTLLLSCSTMRMAWWRLWGGTTQ